MPGFQGQMNKALDSKPEEHAEIMNTFLSHA